MMVHQVMNERAPEPLALMRNTLRPEGNPHTIAKKKKGSYRKP